ncbi:MAG: NAD(+) diphosphatase [Robiginitomaculum sp.]
MTDILPFSGAALDLAENERSHEQLHAFTNAKNARALLFHHGEILTGKDGRPIFLEPMKMKGTHLYDPGPIFLGLDGKIPVFAFSFSKPEEALALVKGSKFVPIRGMASQAKPKDLALAGKAKSLIDWHRFHLFCAACGQKSEPRLGGIMRKCPSCNTDHYPRVNPVVIMFITNGDNCLLGRSPGWPDGAFSALAGFVSPGESIEEACKREVMEEVGVRVDTISYKFSQPWPFPSQLMIGLFCETSDTTLKINKTELDTADWFYKEDVRGVFAGTNNRFLCPPDFTIAHHLMKLWLKD